MNSISSYVNGDRAGARVVVVVRRVVVVVGRVVVVVAGWAVVVVVNLVVVVVATFAAVTPSGSSFSQATPFSLVSR